MQKAKEREAWNRAHPSTGQTLKRTVAARHDGPVARIDVLKGNGRIYLVQMGDHKAPYALDNFEQWLRSKYSLDVQVLPAMAIDQSAWDSERKQYVAELLYAQIKREHPDLAANPNVYLIGFTDADMYSVNLKWRSSFTQRDLQRAAIISADGMQDNLVQRLIEDASAANRHFQARLRRILLKDVAVLYWHLPLNNDPTSLLHQTLDPDLPVEDIYESDLDPARTASGEYLSNPSIAFSYSTKDGIKPMPGATIRECDCDNIPVLDESMELFEVSLGTGLLIDKHTDFSLPDSVPIQFQRVTRDGWSGSNPFGISGTDNYDEYLWSKNNIQISVIYADGGRTELVRVPRWLPIVSLVKYVDADYSGKYYKMRWRSSPFEHYDLKRYDGEVKTYLPCNSTKIMCYLTGYRNAQGQELKFERDGSRKLTRLTSPNNSWLRLSYGPSGHIAEIDDSRGRAVRYGYDRQNRLISVTYPSGEVFHYEYDGTQHLLTFSVAPDAKTAPRLLLSNEYENGRIAKQTFADGATYLYNYTSASDGSISAASVHTPDGKIFNINLGYGYASVREQDAQTSNPGGQPVSR